METFIQEIFVKESRNLKDFRIPLSKDSRSHLILTGKNGSGKTSLLLEINKYFSQIDNNQISQVADQKNNIQAYKTQLDNPKLDEANRKRVEQTLRTTESWFDRFGGTEIQFSSELKTLSEKAQSGRFLLAFFDAKRHTNINVPGGINKLDLKKKYNLGERANQNFLQYIVNLKADRSFARDDGETDVVKQIDLWFDKFENRLKEIFDVDQLELKFDRKTYNFDIIINGSEPFGFNTLSDGYSAIISIVTELLLRMEAHNTKSYSLEGVVIIDEIETHLHVELQKKILPFLVDFFPKLQFIITTHSPFVLSSLSNVVICDLQSKTITDDLTAYSYDALIESYFETDQYSQEVKSKVSEFEALATKKKLTNSDKGRLKELRNYFSHFPKYLSKELTVKIQQLELKLLNKD